MQTNVLRWGGGSLANGLNTNQSTEHEATMTHWLTN